MDHHNHCDSDQAHQALPKEDILRAVEAHCQKNRLKFTDIRRRVLEILLDQEGAMGAYEILDVLRGEGRGAQPPVAYRALDFLTSNGFAHKIERINAFVACTHPGHDHAPAFMICRSCDAVSEAHREPQHSQLNQAAAAQGFVIEHTVVEAEGICAKCAD